MVRYVSIVILQEVTQMLHVCTLSYKEVPASKSLSLEVNCVMEGIVSLEGKTLQTCLKKL